MSTRRYERPTCVPTVTILALNIQLTLALARFYRQNAQPTIRCRSVASEQQYVIVDDVVGVVCAAAAEFRLDERRALLCLRCAS